jgi:putative ABC transport system permease protein
VRSSFSPPGLRVVPLGRRQLFAEPRRLLAAAMAVGLAISMILLVQGLWEGMRQRVTVYEDAVGADLYVVAPGTRMLFGDNSTIPISTLRTVRATPGVTWAAAIRAQFIIVDLHAKKVPISLVGYVPGERGGPWAMARGRAPRLDDEVVVDDMLARRHGLRVGQELDVLGHQFRLVGTSRGTASFMTGFAFVTHRATDALMRQPGTTSAVLIGATDPAAVRSRLTSEGLTVLSHAELRAYGLKFATQTFGLVIRVMVAVAFAVGALVIALTAYAAIVERRREYGIVKAIGASSRRLSLLVLGQTLTLAAVGGVTGVMLFVLGRFAITNLRPQFSLPLTEGTLAKAALAALAMAVAAALIPARRLARLDPASAYRGD